MTLRCHDVETLRRRDVVTLRRHDVETLRCHDVKTLRRRDVGLLVDFSLLLLFSSKLPKTTFFTCNSHKIQKSDIGL